jgi:hypothetical protein
MSTGQLADVPSNSIANPNIFELEKKPKVCLGLLTENLIIFQLILQHDIGAGAQCLYCDHCPGLDLHFWRCVCACPMNQECMSLLQQDLLGVSV